MGDMGEMYRAWNDDKKERRKRNLPRNVAALEKYGINFDSRNDGYHLVILHEGKLVDFWPSSGKWRARVEKQKGFGVTSLLEWLGFPKPPRRHR